MMDNQPGKGSVGGIFGGIGPGSSPASQLSPYLNIDPSYLSSQTPEFIFNQDQKRGRMENSFTAIGTSVILGSAVGGAYGLYDGVRQTALAGMGGKLRRTQIMNYTLKSGGSVSNSLGSIAVLYSSLYVLLSQIRDEDDELKSVVTGTLTGALYKSSSGLKKCAMGGAFGLTVAALWAFLVRKDERVSNYI